MVVIALQKDSPNKIFPYQWHNPPFNGNEDFFPKKFICSPNNKCTPFSLLLFLISHIYSPSHALFNFGSAKIHFPSLLLLLLRIFPFSQHQSSKQTNKKAVFPWPPDCHLHLHLRTFKIHRHHRWRFVNSTRPPFVALLNFIKSSAGYIHCLPLSSATPSIQTRAELVLRKCNIPPLVFRRLVPSSSPSPSASSHSFLQQSIHSNSIIISILHSSPPRRFPSMINPFPLFLCNNIPPLLSHRFLPPNCISSCGVSQPRSPAPKIHRFFPCAPPFSSVSYFHFKFQFHLLIG